MEIQIKGTVLHRFGNMMHNETFLGSSGSKILLIKLVEIFIFDYIFAYARILKER